MIGRDKKINQGVYVGAGEREAIVVDDEKDLPLNDVYKQLLVMRLRAKKIEEPLLEKDYCKTFLISLKKQCLLILEM